MMHWKTHCVKGVPPQIRCMTYTEVLSIGKEEFEKYIDYYITGKASVINRKGKEDFWPLQREK